MIKTLALNGKALLTNNKELGWIVVPPEPDPYNPLNLPPNTVRVRTIDGEVPLKDVDYTRYDSATLVSGTTDVYDVFKSGQSFQSLLWRSRNVVEVLGANTKGIRNMGAMFYECTSLSTVPLFDTTSATDMSHMFMYCRSISTVPIFDTSNVTNMTWMFYDCSSLSTVPLFDTSKVTRMDGVFWRCTNVQSGALAFYQQASSQANPPSQHNGTFYNCGTNTTTGAAELAQIPDDWK